MKASTWRWHWHGIMSTHGEENDLAVLYTNSTQLSLVEDVSTNGLRY